MFHRQYFKIISLQNESGLSETSSSNSLRLCDYLSLLKRGFILECRDTELILTERLFWGAESIRMVSPGIGKNISGELAGKLLDGLVIDGAYVKTYSHYLQPASTVPWSYFVKRDPQMKVFHHLNALAREGSLQLWRARGPLREEPVSMGDWYSLPHRSKTRKWLRSVGYDIIEVSAAGQEWLVQKLGDIRTRLSHMLDVIRSARTPTGLPHSGLKIPDTFPRGVLIIPVPPHRGAEVLYGYYRKLMEEIAVLIFYENGINYFWSYFEVALREAVFNGIKHGAQFRPDHFILIRWHRDPEAIHVEVIDEGEKPFGQKSPWRLRGHSCGLKEIRHFVETVLGGHVTFEDIRVCGNMVGHQVLFHLPYQRKAC